MRIYVASSWRNARQPTVVAALRAAGHEVYDFRHPNVQGPPDAPHTGFAWSDIDSGWQDWTIEQYRSALSHPVAERGFGADFAAMRWADAFVYVLPCGRSASLELGWACGAGKRTVVLLADAEPELMIKLADRICISIEEVLEALDGAEHREVPDAR